MKIGIDAMGGDYAPDTIIEGAVDAFPFLSSSDELFLIGDEKLILGKLNEMGVDPSRFVVVHASQTIAMGDTPSRAFAQKPDSSIAVGYKILAKGDIDGFCSAGNTGAMLIGARYTINVIPGVLRPALVTVIPSIKGKKSVILDVGLNPDCKVDVLVQYGILGSIYAKFVLNIDDPVVKLLNIGSEPSKGTPSIKAAHEIMRDHPKINFGGNIEGNELFLENMADVIVCDGFIGNIVLKETEAMHEIFKRKFTGSDPFFDNIDSDSIGGTPIIGVNGNVVIGHGASNKKAAMNMILQTTQVVKVSLAEQIRMSI